MEPTRTVPMRLKSAMIGTPWARCIPGANELFLAKLMKTLSIAILVSAALAALLGLGLSIQITRPLALLDGAARRIAAGELAVMVPVSGRDEVASLSASFNAMTEELKRLDEAKRRIIADSAHERRTRVTLIRGLLEGVIDGVHPLDMDMIKSVHDETLRLSRLIDMLHELELIDSGELKLSLDEVELIPALEKAASLFGPSAGEKGICIEVGRPDTDGARARVDVLRFDEVLYNLIGNAIKYSPKGGKVLCTARRAGPSVRVAIEDSGPGIPEPEREKVFERFYRMDKSRAQDSGGRGLGLSIGFEIVKAHGGSIGIEDSPLGGSSFVVTLPAIPTPA